MEGSQPSAAGGDGAPTATRTQAAIVLTGQKVTLARVTPCSGDRRSHESPRGRLRLLSPTHVQLAGKAF